MSSPSFYMSYIFSFIIGYLIIKLLSFKEEEHTSLILTVLAGSLGLGMSAEICFISLVIFNQLNSSFVVTIHIIIFITLLYILNLQKRKSIHPLVNMKALNRNSVLFVIIMFVLFVPMWLRAHLYPFGGWDAWSVWNFKARMLFLGGENWQNIFLPSLWRTSPHYPLLLPLVNVWGWIFVGETTNKIPLFTALVFTFLTSSLLLFSVKRITSSLFSMLSIIVILTLSMFVKLATSQYSDLIVGHYLFASIVCLVIAKEKNSHKWTFLSGLMLGLLSFVKTEGLMSAIIILGLATPFLWWKNGAGNNDKLIKFLFIGAGITFIPSGIFYLFFAPENITKINGLTSTTDPSTFWRLKTIIVGYVVEIFSSKWHGLWLVLIGGLIAAQKRIVHSNIILIPAFLIPYAGMITAYYYINTRWPIQWWLDVSLTRMLFTILPLIIYWIFHALWIKET